MPNFFQLYAKFHWLVCQNCTLSVHRIVFTGGIFFEKNTFPFVFHLFGGLFLGFWQNCSSSVVRTTLASRICIRVFANFFPNLRKILLCGLSELHSRCPQVCFHGKHLLWEKHFSNCTSQFRRIIPRFLANFFQHVGQNYISFQVFVFGFMPILFRIYGKFYWPVHQNCPLRVHSIVFMGSIFFGKNTFPIVFHILGGTS